MPLPLPRARLLAGANRRSGAGAAVPRPRVPHPSRRRAAEPSLSATLVEFAEPLLARLPRPSYEQGKLALALAVLSWNAGQLPAAERAAYLDEHCRALLLPRRPLGLPVRDLLAAMVRRKVARYAADRRFIVDYEIAERPPALSVQVVSRRGPPRDQDSGWKRISTSERLRER